MSGNRTLEGKNGEIAIKMLKRVTRLLENNNIPYILDAGTLLGIVRENRLLPWDNDLDLSITKEFEKKLLKNIWKLRFFGYKVKIKYYSDNIKCFKANEPRIIKIFYLNPFKFFRKDVALDIFLKQKVGDEYYWTEGLRPPVLKVVSSDYYDNLTQITFRDKQFSIPKNYIDYIECRYGKDWRTPVKKWDFKTNDLTVKEFLDPLKNI